MLQALVTTVTIIIICSRLYNRLSICMVADQVVIIFLRSLGYEQLLQQSDYLKSRLKPDLPENICFGSKTWFRFT